MGWEGTRMLTKGEHDELWRNAFTVIPKFTESLSRSNAIECVKILHDAGKITDDGYLQFIEKILSEEGYRIN